MAAVKKDPPKPVELDPAFVRRIALEVAQKLQRFRRKLACTWCWTPGDGVAQHLGQVCEECGSVVVDVTNHELFGSVVTTAAPEAGL